MQLKTTSAEWFARLSIAACAVFSSPALLQASPLDAFQPVERWHTVGKVAAVAGEREIKVSDEGEILVNGTEFDRSIPYLFSKNEFGDVHIEFDFLVPKGSNSGVYVMGRYEIQIFDSFGRERVGAGDLGGLYPRRDWELKRSFEGTRPLVNAAKPPGEWQKMEIFFRAPKFDAEGKKISNATFEKVLINDQLVQRNASTSGPTTSSPLEDEAATGPIAIQGDHGPVAIRNFKATPLPCGDEARIKELDAFWAMLSKAVNTGDFETFQKTAHPSAVLISGRRGRSEPLANALNRWRNDFTNTREKLVAAEATFRWDKRFGDSTTAYETGILRFVSQPKGEEPVVELIHFDAALVKEGDDWQILTEYQKGLATQEEWDALAPQKP
ncbi:MAG: family 16 glycoside hydrolase [Luteolibacter sp.]